MEKKVASLETQIALMQNDIDIIKNKQPELPRWLKNSAIVILMALFGQIMTSVWWASSISTKVANMNDEISLNSEFRNEFPKYHNEVIIEVSKLKVQNDAIKERLDDIKSKMKWVTKP